MFFMENNEQHMAIANLRRGALQRPMDKIEY